MRDAFLVTDDSTCTLLTFAALLPNFRFVEFEKYTALAFDEDDCYVGIEQDDSILTCYEDDERKKFESLGVDMSAARAFVIQYRNTGNSLLQALRLMVHQPNLLFDNDHGLICPLETLVELADRAPAWDWTTSAELVSWAPTSDTARPTNVASLGRSLTVAARLPDTLRVFLRALASLREAFQRN